MTTEPRREVRRGLQGRVLLGKRLSRRALLAFPFPRGDAGAAQEPLPTADAGQAVPRRETSHPVRCGACGGYHVLNMDCPVDAHQRALARTFPMGPKAESPPLESETREEERGS